jgi:hypothetical protein
LNAGKHTFKVAAQWGWIYLDYLMLSAPSSVLRNFDRASFPVARQRAGGIRVSGIDGIRRITVLDVSGKALSVLDPSGSSADIPVAVHGIVFLSFEDLSGNVSSSKVVLP